MPYLPDDLIVETLDNWPGGVISTIKPDQVPKLASPLATDSALFNASNGNAVPGKRKGVRTINPVAITSSPAIIGQFDYKRRSAATFLTYHLVVDNLGGLGVRTGSTINSADTAAASPFTAGSYYPDFAVLNNLVFIVNGQENKKFNGTNVQAVGITAPTVGTMAGADGGAGSHNGTYQLRVSYYNGNTGQESSISATASATINVTNKKIDWTNIPVSADAQVTARYLYVRNTSTMSQFMRAGTVSDNTATTATTNVADSSLSVLAPDTSENDAPGVLTYVEAHASRLVGVNTTSPSRIVYSKVGLPEAFDPDFFLRINEDDGQAIMGLLSTPSALIVFKKTSVWAVLGMENDPAVWTVVPVTRTVGAVSHRAIIDVEGNAYFWSEKGPMMLRGLDEPTPLGYPTLADETSSITINYTQLSIICGEVDPDRRRILWAVPELGQTRNTKILPFNYQFGVWEAAEWQIMDTASLGRVQDLTGTVDVYLGGYGGQLFRVWDTDNDGVPSGTTTGTVSTGAGVTSLTTLTDATASFYTTGAGLAERYLTIQDSNGAVVWRGRISSNTATVITPASSIVNLTASSTYTYYVGAIDFMWDTPWMLGNGAHSKKRFEFLYAQSEPSSGMTITIDVFTDYSLASVKKSLSLTPTGSASDGVWDIGEWDEMYWAPSTVIGAYDDRFRMGCTGRAWRARVRNRVPNQAVVLTKLAMYSLLRGRKLG